MSLEGEPGSVTASATGDLREAVDTAVTWAGAAGAVVAFTAILLSIQLAPWFSWTGNALSELGYRSLEYSWVFNGGLMLAGALGFVFVARVSLESRNRAQWAGASVLLASMLSLAGIGLYPAGHHLHNPASTAFFVALTYGLLLYGTGDVLAGDTRRGLVTVWLGAINATGWLVWVIAFVVTYSAGGSIPGVALPEFLGALALGAWVVPATRRLLRS